MAPLPLVFSTVNFNITILFRMLQRQSPFTIRLHRVRQYDTPFGANVYCMKFFFLLINLYVGYPMSHLHSKGSILLYLFLWYILIYWWTYLSRCQFKYCLVISLLCVIGTCSFTYYNFVGWIPILAWSMYMLYISIWFHCSYAKTNFILS